MIIDKKNFSGFIDNIVNINKDIDVCSIEENQVIALSNSYASQYGYKNYRALIGKNLNNYLWQAPPPELSKINTRHVDFLYKNKSAEAIIINGQGQLKRIKHEIIIDSDGADYAVYGETQTLKLNDLTHVNTRIMRYDISLFETSNVFGVPLTPREELIVSYLLSGYTVSDIARIFNVSRSLINKIVNESLNIKFEVTGGSSKFLKEILIDRGYQHFIPASLIDNPGNIILANRNLLDNSINYDIKRLSPEQEKITLLQNSIVKFLELNFSQEEIANKLGISRAYVAKIICNDLFRIFNVKSRRVKDLMQSFRQQSPTVSVYGPKR